MCDREFSLTFCEHQGAALAGIVFSYIDAMVAELDANNIAPEDLDSAEFGLNIARGTYAALMRQLPDSVKTFTSIKTRNHANGKDPG